MIFEILIVLSLIVGIVLSIVNRVNKRSNEPTLACMLIICILLILLGVTIDSTSKASVHSVNDLKPLKYAKLQELTNQKYVIHSTNNGKYYFMHDGIIDDAERVLIVNMEDSKFDKPTMIKCEIKPSLWRSVVLSRAHNNIIYVLVVNEDQILEQRRITEQKNALPEWLSSH